MELLFTISLLSILVIAPIMLLLYFILTYGVMAMLKYFTSPPLELNQEQEARATVVNVELTGKSVNNRPVAILEVEVEPTNGKSFISEVYTLLPILGDPYLGNGSRIKVRYNCNNHLQAELVSA